MREAAEGHLTTEALMWNQNNQKTISGMSSEDFRFTFELNIYKYLKDQIFFTPFPFFVNKIVFCFVSKVFLRRLRLNKELIKLGYDISHNRYPEGYQEAPLVRS